MQAGRMKRTVLLFVIGVACLFSGSAAQASDSLGQFCWQSVEGTVYTFAVNDMGNNHYLINGRATTTQGDIFPFNGNAEAGPQGIYVTFSGGKISPGLTSTIHMNWTLDSATYHGTGKGTMTTTDDQAQPATFFVQDTINFISCP